MAIAGRSSGAHRRHAPEPQDGGPPPNPSTAPPAPSLDTILDTNGTPEVRGKPWKKRVPLRFSRADILRIDAVRKRLPVKLTRAQMVRTFALYALAVAEKEGGAP